MNTQSHEKSDRLLSLNEARSRVGLARSTVYRLIAEGQFPTPVKVGTKSLFSDREIDTWIEARLLGRQAIQERTPQ